MNIDRKLDPNVSYRRRYSTAEIVCIILGTISLWAVIGLIFFGIAIYLQFAGNTIVVSEISNPTKITVDKFEWDQYRQEHGITYTQQYRRYKRHLINNNVLPSEDTDVAEQLVKYKKLLDDGAITQDEFDTKKSQLLKL